MIGAFAARLTGLVAGVWVAFEAGAGVHSDGPAPQRFYAALVVVGLAALPVAGISWFLHLSDVWNTGALGIGAGVGVIPGLLVAVPVTGALGLPYEVSGFWGLVLATAAIGLVAFQASRTLVQVIVGDPYSFDIPLFGGYLVTIGGFWAVEAALPGVHFPGSLGEKLATLAVMAAFFRVFGGNVAYFIRAYGLARIVPSLLAPLLVAGLKLWALCWLSSTLTTTLSIDGFWWFALAAALLTAATAPVWLFEQWMREEQIAEQYRAQWEAQQQHQQAVMNLTMMSALNASRIIGRHNRW